MPSSAKPKNAGESNRALPFHTIYDKNGNITSDIDPLTSQARSFVFDGNNKQAEVKNSSGITIGRYYYDGEGKRVKKVTDTEETIFVYSAGKLVAEYSTEAPPTTPTTKYLSADHLGTPRIITDAVGNVVSRRDFMPFGEELTINVGARSTPLKYGTTEDNVRQKFTGYQKDNETSLDFAEARMYENRYGRFTAVDPLLASGKSANPQTFNRYVYCRNAPLILIDPTGQIPGDYWSRNGVYLGSDGKDDGKVYFADEVKRDETNVWVNNIKPTTRSEIDKIRGQADSQNEQTQAEQTLGVSPNSFTTISERANFYATFGQNSSNGTRWASAAANVANDVDWLTRPATNSLCLYIFCTSNYELGSFANNGNRLIFEDAFPKLGKLKSGSFLSPEKAFEWDANTLAQEQTLVQPLYERLSPESMKLLDDNLRRNNWGSYLGSPLTNSRRFPENRDVRNVSHRWEFGMKAMGYEVTPAQMPNPGSLYTSGEMFNRFNPTRPVGPIIRVTF